jgi:hypothetical protein
MDGALLQRRGRRLRRERLRPADHLARLRAAGSAGRGPDVLTLDDVITGAWQTLGGCEIAQCPVCGGEMGRSSGANGFPAPHGECVDCGTRLS